MALAGNIKGITIEFAGDTTKLSKALDDINKRSKTINSALKDVNYNLKFNPANTELLAQKQQLLARRVEETRNKLKALQQAEKDAQQQLKSGDIGQDEFDALRREIIKTEQQLKTFTAEYRALGSVNLTAMSANFDKWGKSLESAGQKLRPISMALGAIGIASVKSASDWDTAWAGVQRRVKGTDEQLEEIRKGIFELAQASASPTEEVARVVEVAGQLGIATENIMDFAKVMIQLGDTTTMTAEEGAESLAKYANIVNLSADDYGRLGSTILELGNNFATSESAIVEFAMKMAGSASQVKLSNQQILALSASLSSVGLEAQAGGSSISKIITQIDKDVALGKDTMETWARVASMSIEDFSEAWQKGGDATYSVLLEVIKGMGEQRDAGENLNVILDELGITNLRTSDTMKRLSNAYKLVARTTDTANKAWKDNTALQTNAEIKYATMSAQLNQMKEALKEVGIELGQEMLPYLRKFVDGIKDMAKWFKNLSPEAKSLAVRLIGIGTALSPLLIAGGKVSKGLSSITGGLSKLVGNIKGAEGGVAGMAKGFITAHPAVTALAVAIGGAIVAYNSYNDAMHKHENAIKKMAQAHEDSIASIKAESIAQERSVSALERMMEVENKSEGQKLAIKKIVDELNASVKDLNLSYDEEQDRLLVNGEAVRDVTSAIRQQIDAQKELMLQQAFSANAEESLNAYADALVKMNEIETELTEKQERLNQLLHEDFGATTDEYAELTQEVKSLENQVTDLGKAMDASIVEYQKNINAGQMLSQSWNRLQQDARKAGFSIPDNLVKGMKQGMIPVPTTIEEVEALINFNDAVKRAGREGEEIVKALQMAILNGEISVDEATKQLGMYITQGIGSGIKIGIPSAVSAIESAVDAVKVAGKRRAEIQSPSRLFRDEIGRMIGLGVAEGIEDTESDVARAGEELISSAIKNAEANLGDLKNIQQGITSTLTSGEQLSPTLARATQSSPTINAMAGQSDQLTAMFNQLFRILGDGKLQIVLDNGVLVGEIAPQMNQELSRIQVRQERGNA